MTPPCYPLGGCPVEESGHAEGSISRLAREDLGVLLDELEEVTQAREVWSSLLRLLPP